VWHDLKRTVAAKTVRFPDVRVPLIAALLAPALARAVEMTIAVIVDPSRRATLSEEDVARIFPRKQRFWPDGRLSCRSIVRPEASSAKRSRSVSSTAVARRSRSTGTNSTFLECFLRRRYHRLWRSSAT
jgi:hypothetical protein